jgi:hypothetical protein
MQKTNNLPQNPPLQQTAVIGSCLIVVKKDKYDDWWYECLTKKYERYNYR